MITELKEEIEEVSMFSTGQISAMIICKPIIDMDSFGDKIGEEVIVRISMNRDSENDPMGRFIDIPQADLEDISGVVNQVIAYLKTGRENDQRI